MDLRGGLFFIFFFSFFGLASRSEIRSRSQGLFSLPPFLSLFKVFLIGSAPPSTTHTISYFNSESEAKYTECADEASSQQPLALLTAL